MAGLLVTLAAAPPWCALRRYLRRPATDRPGTAGGARRIGVLHRIDTGGDGCIEGISGVDRLGHAAKLPHLERRDLDRAPG